jgi:hypothetical protein
LVHGVLAWRDITRTPGTNLTQLDVRKSLAWSRHVAISNDPDSELNSAKFSIERCQKGLTRGALFRVPSITFECELRGRTWSRKMRSISPVAAIILLTLISVVLYYAIEMLKRSLVTWRP